MAGRSWTDPFSNHTELANVDLRENLASLVELGGAPPALLLPLLHEATHHWCFLSPVGNVIAWVKARARSTALSAAGDLAGHDRLSLSDQDRDQLMLDVVMCEVATAALRPFGEGLALAAELDSLTRKTEFVSSPFLSAARAFAPPAGAQPAALFAALDQSLILARKGYAGIRRKLNVYADPLGPDGEGYLTGYLTVRWMMRELGSKSSRLIEESDLCVSFLRSFFYDDLQFMDTLLDRDTDPVSLANSITNYVGDRIRALREVTYDDVAEFERHFSAEDSWNKPGRDVALASVLHYDAQLASRGMARAEQLAADLNRLPGTGSNPDSQEPARFLLGLEAELFKTRHLVDLGTCDVEVQVRDGKYAVRLGGSVILEDLATAADDRSGPGTLDACYDTELRTQDRILIVAMPDEVIGAVSYGPAVNPDRQLPDIDRSRSDLREQLKAFDKLLSIVAQVEFGGDLDHITAQMPAIVDSLYLDAVLSDVPDEHLDRVLAALRSGGLRAVLDNNRDLAEALAIAGAVCGGAPFRQFAESELKARQVNVALLDELLDTGRLGMRLVMAVDNWFVPLV
jgi:hypothetical protein